MKYLYDATFLDEHKDGTYYTWGDMDSIRIYPATPKLMREAESEASRLWPISPVGGYSWEFEDCKSLKDAKRNLLHGLNLNIYQAIMDI